MIGPRGHATLLAWVMLLARVMLLSSLAMAPRTALPASNKPADADVELEHAPESMPLERLFEGEAFVRYRALIDLPGRQNGDKEVVRERALVPEDRLVRRILDRRNADGYWGTP